MMNEIISRLLNHAGTQLNQSLTDALGASEADRVFDALTPAQMMAGGCPRSAEPGPAAGGGSMETIKK